MTARPDLRCFRFAVRGEADPQLAARILGLITITGELPTWFQARLGGDGVLHIEIERQCDGADAARQFVERILKIPTVHSADVLGPNCQPSAARACWQHHGFPGPQE